MVVFAVQGEPVSGLVWLVYREVTGNLNSFERHSRILMPNYSARTIGCEVVPCS